jgi:hypothetical protein
MADSGQRLNAFNSGNNNKGNNNESILPEARRQQPTANNVAVAEDSDLELDDQISRECLDGQLRALPNTAGMPIAGSPQGTLPANGHSLPSQDTCVASSRQRPCCRSHDPDELPQGV